MVSRSREIDAWLGRLTAVGEADWTALVESFPTVSAKTLRYAVRRSGLPLAPLVEGVRQESFEELARTLVALQVEYEGGNRERQQVIRSLVIEAKTHAKFQRRRLMAEWMVVWLNDPELFDAWVKLALRSVQSGSGKLADPNADEAEADG